MTKRNVAALVGRYCPLHIGHEAVISAMIERYGDDCLVGVGSANHPI